MTVMPFTTTEATALANAANEQGGSYSTSDVQTQFTGATSQQIALAKLWAAYVIAKG